MTNLTLQDATVLVTGATGSIGGRLVDYLLSHYQIEVRALVRSYGRAVRLARQPVKLIPGDLLNPESLRQAAEGCDVIFHCAAGMNGEDEVRKAVTIDGTRNILQAALDAGVKRFVHVSTVAVHGPNPGPILDETTPIITSGDLYSDAKAEAERLAFEFYRNHGLPVTVLRPAIVYGPRSGSWTLGPINNLKRNRLFLLEDGIGLANHVYIDDVVQAMLRAATRAEAVGEAFVIAHGTSVTWKEFFGYYARMMDMAPRNVSIAEIEDWQRRLEQLHNPLNMALTFVASPRVDSLAREVPGLGKLYGQAQKLIPKRLKGRLLNHAAGLREAKIRPPVLPRPWVVEHFCAQSRYKIDKAQRLLGYQPQVSLEEGMNITESWLRHTRVI